jgi:hypothetical protein
MFSLTIPVSSEGGHNSFHTPTHRRLGRNSLCFSVWGILLGT